MIRLARYLPTIGILLSLVGCGGGSDSGGGTANSPFVGTYRGSSAVTVTTQAGSQTLDETISVYVNPDGLVQVGDGEATIYASGPLQRDTVRLEDDASEIVDPGCSGTINLAGRFAPVDGGGAVFTASWSSSDASCFGVSGAVSGPVSATRISLRARATRVFQTNSGTLLRAFRRVTR
jgi:hypothetical protein